MGDYEQSNTETGRGNRGTATRRGVFNTVSNSIIREETDRKAQERKRARDIQQGNGKYVMNGSNDRVNGKGYNDTLYPTEEDKNSYYYGYVIHGGRRLLAVIDALKKENRIEEIMQIGYRDFEHAIPEDHLGLLKQNMYYMEGYNAAQKAKKAR